ncbi:glutaredoxin [Dentipellis sp. KUC8613]|nr:glutaredoxin [Dentipellis sp. KUC8613]
MSVKQLVSEAIDQNKIAIFSKSYCPYCRRAKALFAESFPDVETVVFELDERDDGSDIQAYLAELTGQRTVPNVFINKTHVGGSDAVAALHKQGGIAKLLQSEA